MRFNKTQTAKILVEARGLAYFAPQVSVEEFYCSTLAIDAINRGDYFPSPDPTCLLAIAVSNLTSERDRLLKEKEVIPNFVVFTDAVGKYFISGLGTYLISNGNNQLAQRLQHHNEIRKLLLQLEKGHHLEALAGGLLSRIYDYGQATRGSGDQGIDAIGWKNLQPIDNLALDGAISSPLPRPSERVFFIASSKATIDSSGPTPSLINPAHIRELIGGWVIQRSEFGLWKSSGIKSLTPIQLILVTTYRLSTKSRALCQGLGLQVWGLPQLISLIAQYAPANIFDANAPYSVVATNFKLWYMAHDSNRISVDATV